MGRQTAWVLALLIITCVPGTTSAARSEQQARPTGAQQAPSARDSKDNKDNKDKPQNGAKPEDRERWKWWLYDRVELGINDPQSAAINQIFESTIPKLRETRQELDKAEDELSRTIKEHKADIAVVSGQLDRVESARSQYNKTRVLMLYRMHLLLSPDQRTKLEAIRARNDQGRRDRQPSPGYRRYP
jgi:Spy/CpxP family protein refolding chaperone